MECFVEGVDSGAKILSGNVIPTGTLTAFTLGGRPKLLLLSTAPNADAQNSGLCLILTVDPATYGTYRFNVTDTGFTAFSYDGSSRVWYYWAVM